MKKTIIIFYLSIFVALSISSRGINGPTKVDGGELSTYRGDFSGLDFSAKVTWRVTHGRFNNQVGPTSITQAASNTIVSIIWDDSNQKGVITASAGGIGTVRLEVDINSVKDMHITDFWCNGNKVNNDVINLPLGRSGTIECSVTDLEYPITHMKIYGYRWNTPKSWGGGIFDDKRTIKIRYNEKTGNGEKIIVTPIGYGGVLGNSKSITIKRETLPPPPPPFDGNIKDITISSNKTYSHSNLYVENVTIKNGANVVMNGYNSVRIVPGFTAELGSTLRIYNGTAKTSTRSSEDEESLIDNEMTNDRYLAKLNQNFPNPASSIINISFVIPENSKNAHLQFYNMMGSSVMKIPIGTIGLNSIDINTLNLVNGIYLYSLIIDDCVIDTKRMIIAN